MAQAVQDAVELFMDDEITALENKLGVCPACHGKKVTYIGGKSPSDAVQFATCGVCRGSGTMVPAQ
jgi:cytochrome c553